jgi:hypothetical protein
MAVFSLSDFTTSPSAMPVLYRELINNVQRLCPTLRTLAVQDGMTGQAINFDVKLGGQTAAATSLDGGSLATAAADIRRSVTLPFGEYSAAMQVTDKLRRAIGAVQGHDFLRGLYQRNLVEAVSAVCKLLNQHIYSGSGSSQQMTGLTTAVASSGAYGGLTDSTYWVATVSENGGTLRTTTIPIIRTHLSAMAANAGNTYGRPDLAFCKPAIFDVVLGLFSITTFVDNSNTGLDVNPDAIYTAAGKVGRTGFRAFNWASEGITFIEDPDVTHTTSTNATAGIYFVNSAAVGLEQLPPAEMDMTNARVIPAEMETLGQIAGLTFEMQDRGRTKTASEWDVTAMCGLKVKCRGATGWLGDLQ